MFTNCWVYKRAPACVTTQYQICQRFFYLPCVEACGTRFYFIVVIDWSQAIISVFLLVDADILSFWFSISVLYITLRNSHYQQSTDTASANLITRVTISCLSSVKAWIFKSVFYRNVYKIKEWGISNYHRIN